MTSALYYTSQDVNRCRKFLRDQGLELDGYLGWTRGDVRGAIYYDAGKWTAAYWETEAARDFAATRKAVQG